MKPLHVFRPARALRLLLLLPVLLLGACATSLSPYDQAAVAGKTYVITGASSGFGRGVDALVPGKSA
jgi:hypothetical protein